MTRERTASRNFFVEQGDRTGPGEDSKDPASSGHMWPSPRSRPRPRFLPYLVDLPSAIAGLGRPNSSVIYGQYSLNIIDKHRLPPSACMRACQPACQPAHQGVLLFDASPPPPLSLRQKIYDQHSSAPGLQDRASCHCIQDSISTPASRLHESAKQEEQAVHRLCWWSVGPSYLTIPVLLPCRSVLSVLVER